MTTITVDNGVQKHSHGLQGLVYETTSQQMVACSRHLMILKAWDSEKHDLPPGAHFLTSLFCNDAAFTLAELKHATSRRASIYQDKIHVYLEWPRNHGWRGRLILSDASKDAAAKNGGAYVKEADWREARRWLAKVLSVPMSQLSWQGVLSDSIAWWYRHFNGPVFAHLTGDFPLQPLPRKALARCYSGLPQKPDEVDFDIAARDQISAMIQAARTQTADFSVIEALQAEVAMIASRKQSKQLGRKQILDFIELNLPVAATAGPAQVFVLAGVHHVVRAGGIRGTLLAPRTLTKYIQNALKPLALELAEHDVESLAGDVWHSKYVKLISSTRASQQPSLRAFLEVFHRFLVILGAEPLPHSLTNKDRRMPPSASIIWPHELERAIHFIHCSEATEQVKTNAIFGLRLGYEIPIRISELWNLRVGDVRTCAPIVLSISPRMRDGASKSEALRREEDIEDLELTKALFDIHFARRQHHALNDDVLLGIAGEPGARYEEARTTELMNAALRYATGNQQASYHDLRHTVFSRRSEPVLRGLDETSDVALMMGVSSRGGHAGPTSTAAYQHLIEEAIADQARKARPAQWNPSSNTALGQFEMVDQGLVSALPVLVPSIPTRKTVSSCDLSLDQRAEMLFRIAKRMPLSASAAVASAGEDVVNTVVQELAQAFVRCGLAPHSVLVSEKRQQNLIDRYYVWARASRQPKHLPLVTRLIKDIEAGDLKSVTRLWNAWEQCLDGRDLVVHRPQAAERFIAYLVGAGVRRSSLVLSRAKDGQPLAPAIANLRLAEIEVGSRDGRGLTRLQIVGPGLIAKEAQAATLSIVGFHWWMLVLWSLLKSKGEVE